MGSPHTSTSSLTCCSDHWNFRQPPCWVTSPSLSAALPLGAANPKPPLASPSLILHLQNCSLWIQNCVLLSRLFSPIATNNRFLPMQNCHPLFPRAIGLWGKSLQSGLFCPHHRRNGSFAASHFHGAAQKQERCRRGLEEVCYRLIVYLGPLLSTDNPTPLGRKPSWLL